MGKTAIVSIFIGFFISQLLASNEGIVLEAEQATIEGVTIKPDSLASNRNYVSITDSGFVEWNFNIKQAGLYRVAFAYRSPEEDKAQFLHVNDEPQGFGIGFTYTPTWRETHRVVRLTEGVNSVKLAKKWGHMDIDYLRIPDEPYHSAPLVSPMHNTLYSDAPRSLTFLLQSNGNSLDSISLNQIPIEYTLDTFPFLADAHRITIDSVSLRAAKEGINNLDFTFRDSENLSVELKSKPTVEESPLVLVSFSVGHGTSVLIGFPTGKWLLVDTGIEIMTKQRVIPFLEANDIMLDYLFITHYHGDHYQGKDLLKADYMHNTDNYYDYRDFTIGDTLSFEETHLTILNSFQDAKNENARSLSFRLEYNDFVYIHGGDIYGSGQNVILERYSDTLEYLQAHVYHANHHFHGSLSREYLINTNPYIFIVSAEEHIYARGAYTDHVLDQVYPTLRRDNYRFIEDLVACEIGHVIVRAYDANRWSYETYYTYSNEWKAVKTYSKE